jgi:alpha-galactosidase
MKTRKSIWLLLSGLAALALMLIAGQSRASHSPAAGFPAQATGTAATFTGRWVVEITGPQGATRETTYFLKQTGDSLTGTILNGYRMQDITEGTVTNGEAIWVVMTQAGGQQRRSEYRGKLVGDKLTITVSTATSGGTQAALAGGSGPQIFTATRTSLDGTPVGPFANLPKETPPALHSVSDGGMARTPPMGWNSWNHFHATIDDAAVRGIADALVSSGMKDAGYVYVNIDDTWEGSRDANGNIQSNNKFPDMKALSDYVHSKGLKLGIYSSPGPKTCAGYEGSYLHEAQDAKTWASWGVDYVKYDWCSASVMFKPEDEHAVYQIMGDALRATGRPIVFSLCQYGQQSVQTWSAQVGGNLWRTTGDISDNWQSMTHIGFDLQTGLGEYAGPGHWNDPDMLEIGNGGMTDIEYQTHMSLWSLLASPLLAGNDPRTMSAATHDTLTNSEVIAIDQDKAGHQGYRVTKDGDKEVWARPLANGDLAVGLFNRGESAATIKATWADLKLSGKHKVRDLWQHKDLGLAADSFSTEVPSHGAVLVRIAH